MKNIEEKAIRKALIHFIKEQDGCLTAIDGISVKDILSWLEKKPIQNESKESNDDERISKSAVLAEIDRLDEFWHLSKDSTGLAVVESLHSFIDSLKVKKTEDKFECPNINVKYAQEVMSRMPCIDKDLRPIAEFVTDYASWNLHKDEWNQPTLEVPLFRVLDALMRRGKAYCGQ